MCAGSIASIRYLQDTNEVREKHQRNSLIVKELLIEAGLEVHPEACTHIIPVMVKDSKRCKAISDYLLNTHGIYVQPINHPTVDKGTERLRITPTPIHTTTMMYELVEALVDAFENI
jgi:5-aminolevulinate synthase